MTKKILRSTMLTLLAGFLFTGITFAEGRQEAAYSGSGNIDVDTTVDFAEVQWTDINSTTAATRIVLEGMGYETKSSMVAVPIAFQSLSTGDIDVFLGDWEPSMSAITEPLFEAGEVVQYHANLKGAKYTLAVPTYVADGGVKDFADIAKFGKEFDYKIYGIEPGNDGNQLIQRMIDTDAFGLGDFELVESSEAGMLTQVKAMAPKEEWIVFLGWAPHPMNNVYDMTYLSGGDDYFGPNYGGATVHTITRVGYAEENPNLGRFFKNLEFTLAMEGAIMQDIADGMDALDAAEKWLKANPGILDKWLDGVTTVDGEPALPAVKASLGL